MAADKQKPSGLVKEIYPDVQSRVFFRIYNTKLVPKQGYFQLNQSHANFREIYSLLLAAALNRLEFHVKTTKDVTTTVYAEVEYVWVDWTGTARDLDESIQQGLERIEDKLDKMKYETSKPTHV